MGHQAKVPTLAYAPLAFLWVFAVLPKVAAAFLYLGLLIAMFASRRQSRKLPEEYKLQFIVVLAASLIFLLSICCSMAFDYSQERLAAAFGTLLYWLLGVGYAYYFLTSCAVSWVSVSKIAVFNLAVLFFLMTIYAVMGNGFSVGILGRHISANDYLNAGTSLRFSSFLEYPTLVAMMTLMLYACAFYWVNAKWKTPGIVVLSILSLVALQACASRAGYLVGVIAVVIGVCYAFASIGQRYIAPFSVLTIIAFLIVLLANWECIVEYVSGIVGSRAGSTTGRMYLYASSIEMTLDSSPIIGMGVKHTSLLSNSAPFGSHSTWIGFFYKTGLVGLVLYVAFFASVLVSLFAARKTIGSYAVFYAICTFLLYIYLAVEDLDGTAWVCVTFFVLASAFMNSSELDNEWGACS